MPVKKKMIPKGKKVKGENYAAADEVYNKNTAKKTARGMKTAGLALELKESQKDKGYSKKPQVKGQKKNAKPVMGKKKAY